MAQPRRPMRADERLSRLDQQAEQFVRPMEQHLESLIVIGASAGGHYAIQETVKGLSRDLPATVIILLHSGRMTSQEFSMEKFLSSSTDPPHPGRPG